MRKSCGATQPARVGEPGSPQPFGEKQDGMGLVYTPRVIERTSLVRSKVAPPLGFALSAKGFRPFFLGAAAFAGVALPAWIAVLSGASLPKGYLDPVSWHAHEMLFGFTIAVIAGFLLTAVGNWTQRETVVGPPLLALAHRLPPCRSSRTLVRPSRSGRHPERRPWRGGRPSTPP